MKILIGVTGSIATYKVCEVVSSLAKQEMSVQVVLTDSAAQFVSPLTFATLSRHRAFTDRDFWHPEQGRPLHIALGEWADIFLIAPLSANTLSKLALGLADNLLLNTVLASDCPLLLAPAMNITMWAQETTQAHWKTLCGQSRYVGIPPEQGLLACDTIGTGRMAEPVTILRALESIGITQGRQDLRGKRLLITAGGTKEFLDPVRYIGNPATGKQGLAIAEAALHRGAHVTLIHTGLASIPMGISAIQVTSAQEMETQIFHQFEHTDWLIMAAAVGDVRPVHYAPTKIPKALLPDRLELEKIPDILLQLQSRKQSHQQVIGFAAQTGGDGEILEKGKEKLLSKGLDTIVINAIDREGQGFGADRNSAIFVHKEGKLSRSGDCSKLSLGHQLLDFILSTLPPAMEEGLDEKK